jgi:hypothetical protein
MYNISMVWKVTSCPLVSVGHSAAMEPISDRNGHTHPAHKFQAAIYYSMRLFRAFSLFCDIRKANHFDSTGSCISCYETNKDVFRVNVHGFACLYSI